MVGEFERADGFHFLRKGKLVPALTHITATMPVQIDWEDGETWVRTYDAAGDAIIWPRPAPPRTPPPAPASRRVAATDVAVTDAAAVLSQSASTRVSRPRPTRQVDFDGDDPKPLRRNLQRLKRRYP